MDVSVTEEDTGMFTLYDLFENAAKKNVNKPAVCFKTEINSVIISYQDLLSECEQISNILEDLGVKNGYIGVHLEHSLCLPVVILGILKSGLAFACLNFDHEPWDLQIVKHLNIRWIFTGLNLQNRNWSSRKEVKILDDTLLLYENTLGEEVTYNYNKDEWIMAYAIETSGTTGQPKIVKVPHQCIVPNIQHLKCLLSIVPDDVIFLAAPLTFDPSINEIFLALTSGALLLIVPQFIRKSPFLLLKMLNNVTIIEATPSFLKCWSKEEIRKSLLHEESSLRVLLLGGEPCPTKDILAQWKMNGNKTQLYNIYGITEVSCWASIHKIIFNEGINKDSDVNEEMKIPLGDALSLTVLKIKDKLGNDISDGEGELFIGSKERVCFVDHETKDNLEFPVFRATGDIVQIDGSVGRMLYVGRTNNTIKRFGYRVNLDKINEAVNCHSSVAQSCCVWNENIEKLGLFLKLESNDIDDESFKEKFRQYLLKRLDLSHVPDIIIIVNSVPLTSHGKVNHCELKKLMIEKSEYNIEKCYELGHAVNCFTFLWSQHLCLESGPSPDDNFMQSGGSSFVAMQLVAELNKVLRSSAYVDLLGFILGHSTYKECCDYVHSIHSNQSKSACNITDMVDHSKKRKLVDPIDDHIKSNKIINVEHSNCSNQNGNKKKLLFSICRGKIEIGDANKLEPCCELVDTGYILFKWTYTLEKCIDASPRFLLYENDKYLVCVGSHSSEFFAIDSTNAEPVIKCNLNDRIESSMCSSPCGEIGVIGCYDGCVYGINLESGDISWKFKTGQMVKSSPALCLNGSAVVVGSYDHHLYCMNVLDGHLIWSTKIGNGSIYSSPCVSSINKCVYVASLDGTCAAVDENNGKLVWKWKLDSPVFSSPGIMPDEDIVVFAEVLGLVHFFSAVSGEKLWNFQAGGNIFSSFSIKASSDSKSNMILFGCYDEHTYCLLQSSNSVTLKWKCKLNSAVFATPFVFPEKKSKGTELICYNVVSASINGMIYLIDLKDGRKINSLKLPGQVFSSPIVYGYEVYVGCRDNKIYCLSIW